MAAKGPKSAKASGRTRLRMARYIQAAVR